MITITEKDLIFFSDTRLTKNLEPSVEIFSPKKKFRSKLRWRHLESNEKTNPDKALESSGSKFNP